jgi:alkylation response protein AidB-like acyl-CoA dehydrogenase
VVHHFAIEASEVSTSPAFSLDRVVQVFGGYGYMTEYPIAKAFVDSRIQTIYGGTTEIQKEIIGRMLGL